MSDPRDHHHDARALAESLDDTALAPWVDALGDAVRARHTALRHGERPRWRAALAALPPLEVHGCRLDTPVVSVDARYRRPGDGARLRRALAALMPWRKGPFRIADVRVDCEWRSDLKWARLAPRVRSLAGRTVLDVGCGSGYHLWRLRGAGAALAVGIDPSPAFLAQFEALQRYVADPRAVFLPLTLEALPPAMARFDTALSMGVLYHRRDPAAHLAELHAALRPGGELVLETLVCPEGADGDPDREIALAGRYARMRNVHALPSARRVERWLDAAGFEAVRTVSVDITGEEEQRVTPWTTRESLADALDPACPALTVEGLPRPRRAMLLARRAGPV